MRRLALALILCLPLTGCGILNFATPTNDPAKQTLVSHRQAMIDARASYAATERLLITLHRNGTISTERGAALVKEMHTTVRPLLEAAQDAIVGGDFDAAILKFTAALANVTAKTKAPPVAAPALFSIPPPEEPVQAVIPVAVILGEIALTALQAYRRKKDEEVAAGISDDARIAELDKQLAAATADDNAADDEASKDFGIGNA